MKKNQFCREVNSPWTRRLLHSVPLPLVCLSQLVLQQKQWLRMLLKFLYLSKLQNLLVLLSM